MKNKIYIASDHAGFSLKQEILENVDLNLTDLGTNSTESVDYPDFASKLVKRRALGRGREALRPQAASGWRRLLAAGPCLPLGWRAAPCDRKDALR